MCRTDHKGLTSLVNNEKSGILTQEEASELQAFNRFKLDICYAPGTSPIMATPDLLSRNLPTHADEIGGFEGGSESMHWGTGNFAKDLGAREDVDIDALTPDDTSSLRLSNPSLRWDGPAHDSASLQHEDNQHLQTDNTGGATGTGIKLNKVPADVYEAALRRKREGRMLDQDEVIAMMADQPDDHAFAGRADENLVRYGETVPY